MLIVLSVDTGALIVAEILQMLPLDSPAIILLYLRVLSTTVLSLCFKTIALSDYRKNSLLWLTKCFPALYEWGLLMHLPHPKEVNIARVILVFQDGGVKQTKGNYRHLLHSKSRKYVTQRWGGSGIFWESSNTSEGQYVSGLDFKYFQILHQRNTVCMGKWDWWMPDWIHPQQWIQTVDQKVWQWATFFLSIVSILKIRFSNFVTGAIHSLH